MHAVGYKTISRMAHPILACGNRDRSLGQSRTIHLSASSRDGAAEGYLRAAAARLGEQFATLGRSTDQIIGKVGSIQEDVQNLKSNVSGIQSDVGSVKLR